MSKELKPCPCGQVPSSISVEAGATSKYAFAAPSCCGEWVIEFNTGFKPDAEVQERAENAWNNATRAVALANLQAANPVDHIEDKLEMVLPPRPEPIAVNKYRLYSDSTLRARELEIIEACKAVCAELEEHYADYCDTALLNGDIALSNAASGEARACRAIAAAFDKLKEQL